MFRPRVSMCNGSNSTFGSPFTGPVRTCYPRIFTSLHRQCLSDGPVSSEPDGFLRSSYCGTLPRDDLTPNPCYRWPEWVSRQAPSRQSGSSRGQDGTRNRTEAPWRGSGFGCSSTRNLVRASHSTPKASFPSPFTSPFTTCTKGFLTVSTRGVLGV